jgi:hypothetical protein
MQYPCMIPEINTLSRTLAEIVVKTHLCRHNIFEPHGSMPKYVIQNWHTQPVITYHSSPEDALHSSTPLLCAERIDMSSSLGPTTVKFLAVDGRLVEKRQYTIEDGKWSSRRVLPAQTRDKLVRQSSCKQAYSGLLVHWQPNMSGSYPWLRNHKIHLQVQTGGLDRHCVACRGNRTS